MSESEMKDTQPIHPLGDTQPNMPSPVKPGRFPRWLVALIVLVLIAIGLFAGYSSGLGQRYDAQETVVVAQLDEQFHLGEQAVEAGNYELAKQYFEFVLQQDSDFPGILAAYTDLLLQMQATPTPAISPTPEVSPTPDLRGAEEKYNTALQLLNSGDWTGVITNLDSLRKLNPTYRTADVDGMYYMALRQRGVGKIANVCQNINLEGGIYDLTMAEHFVGEGNLGSYAEGLRTYARLYIIGASFWDQDWLQAQNFFAQVMEGYPEMTDSSCLSATKRWYQATINLGNQYLAAGEACEAEKQYAAAITVNDPFNTTAYPTATAINNKCNGTTGGDGGGGDEVVPTDTPTPEEIPTETVTSEPSPTEGTPGP
jgi:tetratricopeptide (TPR) repeat protein